MLPLFWRMNILYLSPNFPPNYFQFPLQLRDFGATVVAIGWGAFEDMRARVAEGVRLQVHLLDAVVVLW